MKTAATMMAILVTTLSPLLAQTEMVVPKGYGPLEGYGMHKYPWSYSKVQVQHLIHSSQIARVSALIRGMWIRRDHNNTSAFNARSNTYEISFTQTAVTPRNMSKVWATNRGGNTSTLVFKGTVNLPAQAAATRPAPLPAPWVGHIPLPTPYVYTPTKGNLLVDLLNTGGTGYSIWGADAFRHSQSSCGARARTGLGCVGGGGEQLKLSIDEHALMTAGKVDVKTTFTTATQGIITLGVSRTALGPLPLPFDLSPLGAPGCMLLNDLLDTQAVSTATSTAAWPIPNDPNLHGKWVYVQGLAAAPGANALGLVVSEGFALLIGSGDPKDPGPAQCVFNTQLGTSSGFMATGLYAGAVFKLEGVFN